VTARLKEFKIPLSKYHAYRWLEMNGFERCLIEGDIGLKGLFEEMGTCSNFKNLNVDSLFNKQ
jgi:hypothetical protein